PRECVRCRAIRVFLCATSAPERTGVAAQSSSSALFLDLGGLATQVAQVVQLGAADITTGHHVDVVDVGAVHREGALHADTERHLADGEGLADTATLAPDDDALEDLDALLRAFDDLHVHIEGVTGPELGDIAAQRLLVDEVKGVHVHPSGVRANRGTWRHVLYRFMLRIRGAPGPISPRATCALCQMGGAGRKSAGAPRLPYTLPAPSVRRVALVRPQRVVAVRRRWGGHDGALEFGFGGRAHVFDVGFARHQVLDEDLGADHRTPVAPFPHDGAVHQPAPVAVAPAGPGRSRPAQP